MSELVIDNPSSSHASVNLLRISGHRACWWSISPTSYPYTSSLPTPHLASNPIECFGMHISETIESPPWWAGSLRTSVQVDDGSRGSSHGRGAIYAGHIFADTGGANLSLLHRVTKVFSPGVASLLASAQVRWFSWQFSSVVVSIPEYLL